MAVGNSLFADEEVLIPADAEDAAAAGFRALSHKAPSSFDQFVCGTDAVQVNLRKIPPDGQQVHMTVIQTGDHRPSAAVEKFRARPGGVAHFVLGSHGGDGAVFDAERPGKTVTFNVNFAVEQDHFFHSSDLLRANVPTHKPTRSSE